MSWYSLLPGELTTIEAWIIRFFVILGTLTICPWAFFLLYDILLYIWRAATYEIPFVGGRARGRRWPAAPSLTERPSSGGRRRRRAFTFTGSTDDDGDGDDDKDGDGGGKTDTASEQQDGDRAMKGTASDGAGTQYDGIRGRG